MIDSVDRGWPCSEVPRCRCPQRMLAEAAVALVPTQKHKRHYADLKASLRDDGAEDHWQRS